jgi:hypothetical protein
MRRAPCIISESADKAKRVIAHLANKHGPTLTEDTWDRILALDDVGELSFCCVVLMPGSNEIHIAQTRHALLENRTAHRFVPETRPGAAG